MMQKYYKERNNKGSYFSVALPLVIATACAGIILGLAACGKKDRTALRGGGAVDDNATTSVAPKTVKECQAATDGKNVLSLTGECVASCRSEVGQVIIDGMCGCDEKNGYEPHENKKECVKTKTEATEQTDNGDTETDQPAEENKLSIVKAEAFLDKEVDGVDQNEDGDLQSKTTFKIKSLLLTIKNKKDQETVKFSSAEALSTIEIKLSSNKEELDIVASVKCIDDKCDAIEINVVAEEAKINAVYKASTVDIENDGKIELISEMVSEEKN